MQIGTFAPYQPTQANPINGYGTTNLRTPRTEPTARDTVPSMRAGISQRTPDLLNPPTANERTAMLTIDNTILLGVCLTLIGAYLAIARRDIRQARRRHADELRKATERKLAHAHKLNVGTRWQG